MKLRPANLRMIMVGLAISILAGVTLSFQNCGQSGFVSMGSSVDEVYPSPFAEKRIAIRPERLEAVRAAHSKTGVKQEPLQLNVIVNNACAAAQCTKENAEALACRLFNSGAIETLKGDVQYYTEPAPEGSTEESLETWALSSPIDQACIVGVSESFLYSREGFNDPEYSLQSESLASIQFEAGLAKFQSATLSRVKVAVIDSGIASTPDLPNVIHRADLRSRENKAKACSSPFTLEKPSHPHATFVAGIIGAAQNNSLGVVGIAPNSDLLSFAVGDCDGGNISSAEIGNAVSAARLQGAEVVNLSLGGRMADDLALRNAITSAANSKIMIVAAAGNDAEDIGTSAFYPASYSVNYVNVLAVAATDKYKVLAGFSNKSSVYVDIAAPGVDIRSISFASSGATYGSGSGTSFSAPMVTAAIALLKGNLKARGIDAANSRVRRLLIDNGSNTVDGLKPSVKGGKFLDLVRLYEASQETTSAAGLTISNTKLELNDKTATVEVTFSWDLSTAPPGARIGVFDFSAGCNASEPCMIQNYALSGPKGTMTIKIPRNQLVAMMSHPLDSTAALPVYIGIYYKIPGKKVFGIVADSEFDVRKLNGSSSLASPSLKGVLANVRMDMQYLYLRGWACFQGDNQAAKIQIRTKSGTIVPAAFGYKYVYMTPHSGPIDGAKTASTNPNTFPHSAAHYADGISMQGLSNAVQTAGFEADPTLVAQCKTLTASHGFDLAIPLSQIAGSLLSGQEYEVIASANGQSVPLSDPRNQNKFTFPDVNFQSDPNSSISIERGPSDYRLTGSVCSSSPSPIEVEAGFENVNFVLAMFDKVPKVASGLDGYFVNSPDVPDMQVWGLGWDAKQKKTFIGKIIFTEKADDDFAKFYFSFEKGWRPNFYLQTLPSEVGKEDVQTYLNAIHSFRPRDFLGSKKNLKLNYGSSVIKKGTETPYIPAEHTDISYNGVTYKGAGQYWDYYDVGLGFSPALVGYDFLSDRTVGKKLKKDYGLTTVLRENKKFETPSPASFTPMSRKQLMFTGRCGSGFNHQLSNYVISNYMQFALNQHWGFTGYRYEDNPFTTTNPEGRSPAETMGRLPITLRFFQDGKLILHLESDYASKFYNVNYRFQKSDYL